MYYTAPVEIYNDSHVPEQAEQENQRAAAYLLLVRFPEKTSDDTGPLDWQTLFVEAKAPDIDVAIWDNSAVVEKLREFIEKYGRALALAGGGITSDETVKSGLRREVHEETHLSIHSGSLILLAVADTVSTIDPDRPQTSYLFLAFYDEELMGVPEPGEEVENVQWGGMQELMQRQDVPNEVKLAIRVGLGFLDTLTHPTANIPLVA